LRSRCQGQTAGNNLFQKAKAWPGVKQTPRRGTEGLRYGWGGSGRIRFEMGKPQCGPLPWGKVARAQYSSVHNTAYSPRMSAIPADAKKIAMPPFTHR
jgi:hypothetical protein